MERWSNAKPAIHALLATALFQLSETPLAVNLHGGFFVGIVLLITYAMGAAGEELAHGTRRSAWIRAQKYLLTAGACGVASLMNPYGYRLHVHVAQYLGASFCFERISEFQTVDFHSFTAAYFESLLVLAMAAARLDRIIW